LNANRVLRPVIVGGLSAAMGFVGYVTRESWRPYLLPSKPAAQTDHGGSDTAGPITKVNVSEQAQANLGLSAKPWKAQTYLKTIPVPGMVVDRPGLSDRGVNAPVTGEVVKIAHVPGETVQPGDLLFTIKVQSESLHTTQTELFKATQEIALAVAQKKRLTESGGAVPETRIIEVDNQISRLEIAAKAYRRELLNRGFAPDQINEVAMGNFVREITVAVPGMLSNTPPSALQFELQELKVDLGQQVQAGQILCTLANHRLLAIEGRAFRDETPLLERSVSEKWPVEVDFQEEPSSPWGEVKQSFFIRHMSNTIDPVNRTFAFLMPLENESKVIQDGERSQTLWRFRPGQKVRLLVRIEEMKNVIVLPADAVTREGPEAYVFVQNDNTFERKSVRVLLHDRQYVVLANDGALVPGTFVVQSGAGPLNRMLKVGSTGGVPKGYHMHADGSVHKNDSEEK